MTYISRSGDGPLRYTPDFIIKLDRTANAASKLTGSERTLRIWKSYGCKQASARALP